MKCMCKYLGADAHHSTYRNYSIILATLCQRFCQDRELKAAWNPGYLLQHMETAVKVETQV